MNTQATMKARRSSKSVFVIATGQGIGWASALVLASEDAQAIATDNDVLKLESMVDESAYTTGALYATDGGRSN